MRFAALLVVLACAAIASYQYYQYKVGVAVDHVPESFTDSAPIEIAEALETGPIIPSHLKWMQDPRWLRATTEGDEAMQKAIALYEWQEAEGGDPLRFRREKQELYQALKPIIEGLEEMKLEYANNPGVLGNLNRRLTRFSAAVSGVLR